MKALIIGYGWLGLPLADHLESIGYDVCGTTRNKDKQQSLIAQGYDVRLFNLFGESASNQLAAPLIENRKVVINIAPGRKNFVKDNYQTAMTGLINHLAICGAKHITFVSTTSVFGQQSKRFDEQSTPEPINGSGEAHAFIESYMLGQCTVKTAVLRLAGLVGLNRDSSLRHPVNSLINKSNIENGLHAVNLIHQYDAIALICAIIEQQTNTGIFHGCASEHPTRAKYYNWAADHLGLGKIDFLPQAKGEQGKIIDASQSLKRLGIKLKYPSPFDML